MQGLEVDAVTGLPKDMVKGQEKNVRDSKTESEGHAVERDLLTKPGGKLIQIVQGKLEERINQLMLQDDYCKSLLDILDEMAIKVSLARSVSKKVVDLVRT